MKPSTKIVFISFSDVFATMPSMSALNNKSTTVFLLPACAIADIIELRPSPFLPPRP